MSTFKEREKINLIKTDNLNINCAEAGKKGKNEKKEVKFFNKTYDERTLVLTSS